MDKTTTTERVQPVGHPVNSVPWRSVYIGSPRRMDGKKFAMIVKRDGREETTAPHATIAQALIIALEMGREHGAAMFYRDRGDLREYVIGRRRLKTNVFEAVLRGAVPRTARVATDHVRVLEFFEDVMEHDPRVFFGQPRQDPRRLPQQRCFRAREQRPPQDLTAEGDTT